MKEGRMSRVQERDTGEEGGSIYVVRSCRTVRAGQSDAALYPIRKGAFPGRCNSVFCITREEGGR